MVCCVMLYCDIKYFYNVYLYLYLWTDYKKMGPLAYTSKRHKTILYVAILFRVFLWLLLCTFGFIVGLPLVNVHVFVSNLCHWSHFLCLWDCFASRNGYFWVVICLFLLHVFIISVSSWSSWLFLFIFHLCIICNNFVCSWSLKFCLH